MLITLKKFLSPFNKYIEHLTDDIHTDMKYSPDLRDYEICVYIDVHYRMPVDRVDHHWLSLFDAAHTTLFLYKALVLFYFTWVPNDMKSVYQQDIDELLSQCSTAVKKRVKTIQKVCHQKSQTKAGKEGKERVVEKLLFSRKKTEIQLNFYVTILPLIKSFVLVFEQKEPMMHRIHDELTSVVRYFFACFLKIQILADISSKMLSPLDVTKAENQLPINQWHIRTDARQILRKLPADHPVKTEFYKAMKQALELASPYIQSKFPLNNNVLKTLTSINPACHGTTIGASIRKRLKTYLPSVIPEAENEAFDLEVNKYHLDKNIPKAVNEDGSSKRLDTWWAGVFDIDGYPHLSKVIKACLSIFMGPMMEHSFSTMNNVIDKKTNRNNVETVNAIQTVKYDLKAKNETTISCYCRTDVLRSPIDRRLCYRVHHSYTLYKKKLETLRNARKRKRDEMGTKEVSKTKKAPVHVRAKKLKCTLIPENK